MPKPIYTFLLLALPIFAGAQSPIPPKAKAILVKNMSYMEVLNALFDKGYTIESKDAELQTAITTPIVYKKYWNGAYKIQLRVKDSVARFTGIYQCPYETQFASLLVGREIQAGKWDNNTFIYNRCDKKGRPLVKSVDGYPFQLMNDFVVGLGKEVAYK
jgi:hypothetical protein